MTEARPHRLTAGDGGRDPAGSRAAVAASVEGDEPGAQRVLDDLGHVVQVELAHGVGAVAVDGLAAEPEQLGDRLLLRVALGDQLEDLALASRSAARPARRGRSLPVTRR